MTLASDTAYHSFAGEVEARTPPRYVAFIPSARHQLPPIAHKSDYNPGGPLGRNQAFGCKSRVQRSKSSGR